MEHQPEPVQFLGWIPGPTGARNSASRFGTLNGKPPRVTYGGPPLLGLWFARRLSEQRALSSTKLRTRGVWSPPQGGIISGRSCPARLTTGTKIQRFHAKCRFVRTSSRTPLILRASSRVSPGLNEDAEPGPLAALGAAAASRSGAARLSREARLRSE